MGYEDLEEFEVRQTIVCFTRSQTCDFILSSLREQVELAVKQYNEIKDPFSWYECRKENETPQQIAKVPGLFLVDRLQTFPSDVRH